MRRRGLRPARPVRLCRWVRRASPARPAHPVLLSPRDVAQRKPGTAEGRIALLHAVAHIELNAVDLHWDIIARFADQPGGDSFLHDVLHRRLVDDRDHLLGLRLRRRQKPGPQTRRRDNGLTNT